MTDPDPRRAAGERLVAALLPALLHRVRNTTQLLVGLRALIDTFPDDVPPRCSDDLANAASESAEHGWLMGLAARALGADVLRAREEREGLEPLLGLLRESLQRNEVRLTWMPTPPPKLGSGANTFAPAEICVMLATVLWDACGALPRGSNVTLEFRHDAERASIVVDGANFDAANQTAATFADALPGLELERDERGFQIRLPRGGLEIGS